MAEDLDPVRLKAVTSEMIAAITSPPFVEAMRQMRLTPTDQKLAAGARLLNPDTLRKEGVPLPEGMRITSRYFELGSPAIDVNEAGAYLVNDARNQEPLGIGGCACGGAASVCGGAGGST